MCTMMASMEHYYPHPTPNLYPPPAAGMTLNVNLQPASPTPGNDGQDNDGSKTPNTAEILNSIVSMQQQQQQQQRLFPAGSSLRPKAPKGAKKAKACIDQYKSQFIKEGLKLKVQQKMGEAGTASSSAELPVVIKQEEGEAVDSGVAAARSRVLSTSSECSSSSSLAPEPPAVRKRTAPAAATATEEERRRRRRDRNKIAATKCREKKKAYAQSLVKESEVLVAQNAHLKFEVAKLRSEKTRLSDMLARHRPYCVNEGRCEGGRQEQPSAGRQQRPDLSQGQITKDNAAKPQPAPHILLNGNSLLTDGDLEEAAMALVENAFCEQQQQQPDQQFQENQLACSYYFDLDSRCLTI